MDSEHATSTAPVDAVVMPLCALLSHQWEETYYGWKCFKCGDFVPFGCEPWSVDDDFEVH